MLFNREEFILLALFSHVVKRRLFHGVEEEFEVFTLQEMLRQLVHLLNDISKLFKGLVMAG